MNKKIEQYSLVDLLEILRKKNNTLNLSAKKELEIRNATDEELKRAENGLKIRDLAKSKSLGWKEKLEAYFIPIYVLITGSRWTYKKRLDSEFDKRIREFENFGELKKVEEFTILKNRVSSVFLILMLSAVAVGFMVFILTNKL